MKNITLLRLAEAIQVLQLDGDANFTQKQLAKISGLDRKTLSRNSDLIEIVSFSLNKQGYNRCQLIM